METEINAGVESASLSLSRIALGSAALVVVLIVGIPPASAFGTDNLSSIHARITRNAFPFMTQDVLNTIVAGNLDEDEGIQKDFPDRHSVNCRFRDSAAYVNMRYVQVIAALREPQTNDPNRAARLFGHILHGTQDFYSHSNWIPMPPQGLGIRGRLVDSGLGFWTPPTPYTILFDDVVAIEGNPPRRTSVRLPVDANGRVSSAVPIFIDANWRRLRGLMTAGAPREAGDLACPPVGADCNIDSPDNVCLRHGESRDSDTSSRNFVGVGRMNLDGGGGGDWFDARHHAKLQTRHEWCRLLHLARDQDPTFVAAGRLLGTWVATDSGENTPHVPGTPCARGAARQHLIEISATPGADAPSSVPFVVFRSDFTDSARATVSRQATKTLRVCGNANDNIVATLIPARTKGVTLVVPVPATARSWTVRDHRGGFNATFVVKVTPNSC